MSIAKPGDWKCKNCTYLNFASRRTCRGCGISKPAVPNNSFLDYQRHNDWNCPNCFDLQFGRNERCRLCNTLRPGFQPQPPQQPQQRQPPPPKGVSKKQGDWQCARCGDYQFARNEVCRRCNAPKTGVLKAPVPNAPPDDSSDDENVCIVCMDKPKQSGFFHASSGTAHTCCCEDCAEQIKNTSGKCPMCNLQGTIFRNFQ